MRFEDNNKDLFITLAGILNNKAADIEMVTDLEHWREHKEVKGTDVPEIRGYMGPEGEGFSFRSDSNFFGINREALEANFPISINNHSIEFASFFDYDWDEDRTWPETISFIISKNGKNVLG